MARWTFHGVQQGEFYGLPPTHKPVTCSGINIFRIADGKIAEIWDLYYPTIRPSDYQTRRPP